MAAADAVAETSATPGPGTAAESAICVLCKAELPRTILCNLDGDLVCRACAKQASLGTTCYRIKKNRWGGRRVIYRCPQCQGELESALDEAGKEDYCPQCGAAFDVPGRYEKFRGQRLTTAHRPGDSLLQAAPAIRADQLSALPEEIPAGSTSATATGKGKWLAFGASILAMALVSAFVVVYMARGQNSTRPTAKAGTARTNVNKPMAGAQAKAVEAGPAAAKLAATSRAGVEARAVAAKAKATAAPAPSSGSPATKLPPAKAAQSVAPRLLIQLERGVAAAGPLVAGASPLTASLPGFRGLGADVAASMARPNRVEEGSGTYTSASGAQAAATFPRWGAAVKTIVIVTRNI